jgi:hypothetical protein
MDICVRIEQQVLKKIFERKICSRGITVRILTLFAFRRESLTIFAAPFHSGEKK